MRASLVVTSPHDPSQRNPRSRLGMGRSQKEAGEKTADNVSLDLLSVVAAAWLPIVSFFSHLWRFDFQHSPGDDWIIVSMRADFWDPSAPSVRTPSY